MTGEPWGYCDPQLHDGRKVPAVWRVQGLTRDRTHSETSLAGYWVTVAGPGGMWAACNAHLEHACHDLLRTYDRVSVVEAY